MRITYRDIESSKFDNVIKTLTRSGKVVRTFTSPSGQPGGTWYWEGKYYKEKVG
jgi:hypothetical protein